MPVRVWANTAASAGLCTLLLAACGSDGGDSAGNNNAATPPSSSAPAFAAMTLFAGSVGGAGNVDGTGASARLTSPSSIAVDAAGNAYVLDVFNYTVRKVTSAGVVTTIAGKAGERGTQDGDAASARLNRPAAIAVDQAGVVYIVDGGAVRRITAAGQVSTVAGVIDQTGTVDGASSAARFDAPKGIAVDAAGVLYVADGSAIIRRVGTDGVVTTVAGKAYDYAQVDGSGTAARFFTPQGITVDSAGNVYVSDADRSRINVIRKISPLGVVTTLAGSAGAGAWTDGTGTSARFNGPTGVTVDSAGNVYVADSGNHAIRKITPAGAVTTIAGKAGAAGAADGAGASALFSSPYGLGADANGNILVADTNNHTIRRITPAGVVTTIAGAAAGGGAQDGLGAAAGMLSPDQVATDSAGNTYVADGNAIVRKISAAGVVTTLAGTAGQRGTADGTGAAARFSGLAGLAVDSTGNVYVADVAVCTSLSFCGPAVRSVNTIRKITPAGVVTTLAGADGKGAAEFADGNGAAARFNLPSGLATDSSGNLYVADCGNGALRKVTPAGVVTTVVRTGVCTANALSNLTSPTPPSGLALDTAGNFYLSDGGKHVIRKITPAGGISVLAGSESVSGAIDGTGVAARFNQPHGIAIDTAGNAYVADTMNHAVRRVTPAGAVTTIAGKFGVRGVVTGSLPGGLDAPQGVAIDSSGALLVSTANGIVRIQ